MTGKSKQAAGEKFAAAKTYVKKAVFCIDNLNTSVTADDIRKFVTGHMSVSVFSCFKVKPRRGDLSLNQLLIAVRSGSASLKKMRFVNGRI